MSKEAYQPKGFELQQLHYVVANGSNGGGASLTPPTESELLDYIMANFPPDFFLDPEQGLVDSSGNGVTVTTNGSPTVNASGGLNVRGQVAFAYAPKAIVKNLLT